MAGPIAFVGYLGAFSMRCSDVPGAEITLFTTFFQGIGYLFGIAIANIFYNVGYWSERLIRPADTPRYRRLAYAFGFWGSIALPFAIPVLILAAGCAALD